MIRTLTVAISVTLGLSFCPTISNTDARAAEVKLLSAAVMKPALGELAGEFERATGHKITISYDSAGAVKNRIGTGELADIAIIQRPVVEALMHQGKIRQGTMVTLARSGVGVAVPKGAVKPDISSVEAFKQSLIAAKSITYPDPAVGAASGIHFRGVLERLGIAEQVNAKAELFKDTLVEFAVSGHADIAITQPMEILATPGYEFVGWLPPELQDYDKFTWAAGVTANAREPNAAEALVTFLTSPIAAAIIKKKGMEPNMSREVCAAQRRG
jgi:molybdate transport system substrate-binding protein